MALESKTKGILTELNIKIAAFGTNLFQYDQTFLDWQSCWSPSGSPMGASTIWPKSVFISNCAKNVLQFQCIKKDQVGVLFDCLMTRCLVGGTYVLGKWKPLSVQNLPRL